MPHITIDHSSQLTGALDRETLVKELHAAVIAQSGSVGVCKTFFRPAEAYVGEGERGPALFVHVDVGLLPGRSEALKARLAESVLKIVGRHLRLPKDTSAAVVRSVEVRDLAESYRLSPSARATEDLRAAG
ncbi:5-carboxymethyl-2-hydroxymuconate delta isomerase [Streptomyces sp. Ru71]|uniref:5-carboxymethyl-2-hydroxymuconate Delta-isomerase n=1 Tax=Streptomyces sp. Ru71 TaxID=2080746 RepID=UPI000CDD2F23|nr:5-carboxymethyl-2-hydroxymuconate delta isomerase [Streptomyces sp. Ru71]POX46469.1 5-carboxymethyl-2-hydroxymuconate delta isomerase [Streptomyces sp. Ru71]